MSPMRANSSSAKNEATLTRSESASRRVLGPANFQLAQKALKDGHGGRAGDALDEFRRAARREIITWGCRASGGRAGKRRDSVLARADAVAFTLS